jgi:hypothetical protein
VREEQHKNTPLITVTLQWSIPDEKILIQHGCQITQYDGFKQVIFPPGTTRSIAYSAPSQVGYKLALPDGVRILQVHLLDFGRSILYPSEKSSSDDLQ